MMNIILHEPEIPHNTGSIGRTCVATGSSLHLIRPLGFSLDQKSVRRAGLDYWDRLDLHMYNSFEEFLEKNPDAKIFMATTKAVHTYADVTYDDNSFIMFGKESAGIPEEILLNYKDTSIRIPMENDIRSLNLSISVSIILYEACRQQGFGGMQLEGKLHHHTWDE